MTSFDPNAAASNDSGIFGLNDGFEEAKLIYLAVPWEATTSYGGGTSNGPRAILEASHQIDLFDSEVLNPYQCGLHLMDESKQIRKWNSLAKREAQKIISKGGVIGKNKALRKSLDTVNALSARINTWVQTETEKILEARKIPALIGGDHACPFGALKAISKKHSQFGVLHFDAHSDTRIAYEGFTWSHASIMYNVLENIPEVEKLVQVGIRDFCEQEFEYCEKNHPRVVMHTDAEIAQQKFRGKNFSEITEKIIAELPKEVWVSFDIDGLDPKYCPHTGTPVPGGLEFNEAIFVVSSLVRSGKRIIGFDLNEVAPSPDKHDEWDANVGARLLYKLSAWTLASQGLASIRDNT